MTAMDVKLGNGEAQHMGSGVYVVLQRDEYGNAQSVVLTPDDLRRLKHTVNSPRAWVRGTMELLTKALQSRSRHACWDI